MPIMRSPYDHVSDNATFPELVLGVEPLSMPVLPDGRPLLEVGIGVPKYGAALMQTPIVSDRRCDCGWTRMNHSGATNVVVRPVRGRRHAIVAVRLRVEDAPPSGVKWTTVYRGNPLTVRDCPTAMLHDAAPVDWPPTSYDEPLVLCFRYDPVDDGQPTPQVYIACSGFDIEIETIRGSRIAP